MINDSNTFINPEIKDTAMMQIEMLINRNYTQINSIITNINDLFRNEILKSLLQINEKYDSQGWYKEIIEQKNAISDFENIHTNYIQMLKELEIINKAEEENYSNFFVNFINDFKLYQKNPDKLPLELFFKFQEIRKIKKLIALAKKMEKRKSQARQPLELFLKTMNEFIGNNDDIKELYIDQLGQISFTTRYSQKHINIQYLSSGEKQLITFFANLIFSVKNESSGIFVVDEPELSLHLSWQKIFVEKTLDINKNLQLIFATHSPEIVGPYRDKMFKLEKKYSDYRGQ